MDLVDFVHLTMIFSNMFGQKTIYVIFPGAFATFIVHYKLYISLSWPIVVLIFHCFAFAKVPVSFSSLWRSGWWREGTGRTQSFTRKWPWEKWSANTVLVFGWLSNNSRRSMIVLRWLNKSWMPKCLMRSCSRARPNHIQMHRNRRLGWNVIGHVCLFFGVVVSCFTCSWWCVCARVCVCVADPWICFYIGLYPGKLPSIRRYNCIFSYPQIKKTLYWVYITYNTSKLSVFHEI